MTSKSVEVVLARAPIVSVIAESKLHAIIKNIGTLPTGQSFELPKVIVPEINSTWSLKLTPTSEVILTGDYSYDCYRIYTIVFEIETQSEAVWKSKQYKFEVNAVHTQPSIQSKVTFLYGLRGEIDQNVKKQETNSRLYSRTITSDGSIEFDITVSISHIKSTVLRNNFYDPTVFSRRVVDNCRDMFENTKYADFTFNVGNRQFKVHKNILAAASSVFDKTFTSAMKESHKNECIIDKIEPDIFEDLMRFIYGGKLPENLADKSIKLYEAAHYYQIEPLMKVCEQEIFLKLDVSTAQDIYQWAHVYDIEDLKLKAWMLIKNEILKIFYPLKGEPLPPQMIQTIIDQVQQEAEFWEQLRN